MTAAKHASNESGFSLIEVVLAMTLMSVALLSMAGLTFQVTRRAVESQGVVRTTTAAAEQVNRLTLAPFEELANEAGCTEVGGDFPHTRCVTVVTVSANKKNVQVILTPAHAFFAPDTVEFDRGQGAKGNPFSTD